MSLIRQGQEAMKQWRDKHAAVDATYRRGAQSTPVRATPATTTNKLDDGETIFKTRHDDWLIDVENMPEWAAEPVRGDRIEFDGKVYEVADREQGHCWHWHGTLKHTFRIHTIIIPMPEAT